MLAQFSFPEWPADRVGIWHFTHSLDPNSLSRLGHVRGFCKPLSLQLILKPFLGAIEVDRHFNGVSKAVNRHVVLVMTLDGLHVLLEIMRKTNITYICSGELFEGLLGIMIFGQTCFRLCKLFRWRCDFLYIWHDSSIIRHRW
jgi:hypothetical protein